MKLQTLEFRNYLSNCCIRNLILFHTSLLIENFHYSSEWRSRIFDVIKNSFKHRTNTEGWRMEQLFFFYDLLAVGDTSSFSSLSNVYCRAKLHEKTTRRRWGNFWSSLFLLVILYFFNWNCSKLSDKLFPLNCTAVSGFLLSLRCIKTLFLLHDAKPFIERNYMNKKVIFTIYSLENLESRCKC